MTTILHTPPDILTQVIAETRRGRIMAMLVVLSALNKQGAVADARNVSPDNTARADA